MVIYHGMIEGFLLCRCLIKWSFDFVDWVTCRVIKIFSFMNLGLFLTKFVKAGCFLYYKIDPPNILNKNFNQNLLAVTYLYFLSSYLDFTSVVVSFLSSFVPWRPSHHIHNARPFSGHISFSSSPWSQFQTTHAAANSSVCLSLSALQTIFQLWF